MQTIIRAEHPDDEAEIDRVEASAFPTRAEADLVRALRRSDARPIISLVAEVEARIVGHILFTPVIVESRPTWTALGLGPVAVEPAFQRRGIGAALVRAGLDTCREVGEHIVFVLGHPLYYPRFGFAPAHPFGIFWEHRREAFDAFMLVELTRGALRGRCGIVRYLPEFAEV